VSQKPSVAVGYSLMTWCVFWEVSCVVRECLCFDIIEWGFGGWWNKKCAGSCI